MKRKKRILSAKIFFFGIFFFSNLFSAAAEKTFFSDVFLEIHEKVPENAAKKMAKIIFNDSEKFPEILSFFETQKLRGDLLRACDTNLRVDLDACRENLKKMAAREISFSRAEKIEFRRALAATRFWDGRLESEKDFDVLTDLAVFDLQLSGKNAKILAPPPPKRSTRQQFSNVKIPFFDTIGHSSACKNNELPLFGGIACVSKFCSDFFCVDISVIPGRRGLTPAGGRRVASIAAMITESLSIAERAKYRGGNQTPVRFSNRAHYFTQIFHFLMQRRGNFIVESRVPPIFSKMIPPDSRTKKRKNYVYGFDKNKKWTIVEKPKSPPKNVPPPKKWEKLLTPKKADKKDKNAAEKSKKIQKNWEKKAAEIRAELFAVRRDFGVCPPGNSEKCSSAAVFSSLFSDRCVQQLLRVHSGNLPAIDEMCAKNFAEIRARRARAAATARRRESQKILELFADGDAENPGIVPQFRLLADEFEKLENSWLALGNSFLKNATQSCGVPKL